MNFIWLRRTSHNLALLFKTIIITGYYGLFRVGKLTHAIKLADIKEAWNKEKILILLCSSKTHSVCNQPQTVDILPLSDDLERWNNREKYCPYRMLKKYSKLRPKTIKHHQFFISSNKSEVKADHVCVILRKIIAKMGLDSSNYDTHSLHIGRVTDLFRMGVPVDDIIKAGHWVSNSVYKYLK